MKNVLVDYHHPQLFQALKYLFEDRLGMKLYRPKGKEWYDRDFYTYYDDPRKTLDFLEKGEITLEEAHDIKFDYVLTTVPMAERCFAKYIAQCQPEAKQIVVLGNVGYVPPPQFPVLTSTSHRTDRCCFFHQEFGDARFRKIVNRDVITSFLSDPQSYQEYPVWKDSHTLFPEWRWMEYGFNARDGYLDTPEAVAAAMELTTWVWHVKHVGEGYGHVIHQAAAMGRPLIVRKHQFRGSVAEKYMIHGVTCFDLDQCPNAVSFREQINEMTAKIDKMGMAIHGIFDAAVDFEKEAKNVAEWLKTL